jgi:predicted nucleotidyltransferase
MKKTIERIVARAVRVSEPEEVILFGSMASGTNNVYSDLDLLLVVDGDFSRRQIIEQVKQYARELAVNADVLVYSKSEVEKAAREQPNSFLASVLKSGKITYKKP